MKILALETSAKSVSVAVLEDGKVLGSAYQNTGLTHSRTLMPLLDGMLINSELSLNDMDIIAVAAGPGSFTGVRIGVAAAKGLAWGRELPCYGVSTLEAMVRGAAMTDGYYCACMDARKQQVYNALFNVKDGQPERICEDRAIGLAELSEELKAVKKQFFLVGDGAELCYNTLRESVPGLQLLPEHLRQQRASGTALAALAMMERGEDGSGLELTPNYIRASQAEQQRARKQAELEKTSG